MCVCVWVFNAIHQHVVMFALTDNEFIAPGLSSNQRFNPVLHNALRRDNMKNLLLVAAAGLWYLGVAQADDPVIVQAQKNGKQVNKG